ncbi:MAG TPA: acyloxyacyl hydrolase [Candidatus Hydrogenedens sp.]|nr:acyloxyacyl hydrolase [Candidatus Hydrogenedens sp.]
MKKQNYLQVKIIIIFVLIIFCCQVLFSDETCKEETNKLKLRLEFGSSMRIGHDSDETDGVLLSSIFDIGKDLSQRTNLSLRLMPFFAYIQESNIEDVAGLGIGGAFKFFFSRNQERGFFTEIHEILCLHEHKFEGNSSNLNFFSGIGLGYKFCPNWDMVLRFGHISNANLKDDNQETNILGINVGYTF